MLRSIENKPQQLRVNTSKDQYPDDFTGGILKFVFHNR